MRGDVNVLRRLTLETRRIDKVQRRLRRKLKKENEAPATYVVACRWNGGCGAGRRTGRRAGRLGDSFDRQALAPHRAASRYCRRLLRARDSTGARRFYAVEVGMDSENTHGSAVVVAPRDLEASVNDLVETVLQPRKKRYDGARPKQPTQAALPGRSFALLQCRGDVPQNLFREQEPQNGIISCFEVVLPGAPVFCLSTGGLSDTSAEAVDENLFREIQRASARLLRCVLTK